MLISRAQLRGAQAERTVQPAIGNRFSMADVLEFQSVRLQLHAMMLRHFGVPDIFSWKVIGSPRDRFWDGDLYAAPALVAIRRDGSVCSFDLAPGETPEFLDEDRRFDAILDAAVIRRTIIRRGIECSSVSAWLIFDDGGRFEVEPSQQSLEAIRPWAGRVVRDHRLTAAHTHRVSRISQVASASDDWHL